MTETGRMKRFVNRKLRAVRELDVWLFFSDEFWSSKHSLKLKLKFLVVT